MDTKTNNVLVTGLNESADAIYQNAKDKGFWDKERNVGELLMLVTSELGEALETHRTGHSARMDNINEFLSSGYTAEDSPILFKAFFENDIKDSFEDKIADAVIRLLDISAAFGIDLEKHINLKFQYNKGRERLHGKLY